MTLFASVALFSRSGQMTFRPPRKEASHISTQARKSAARYWNGIIQEPDKLSKVFVIHSDGLRIIISERAFKAGNNPWVEYTMTPAEAAGHPHLAASLAELGIDPKKAPPDMPDVLEINGFIYRRDI